MKTICSARTLLSVALASVAFGLRAADWYVAPTGSDTTGTGTLAAPFQTIQRGVNAANPGDTVLVAPGVYQTGQQTTTPASGKSRVAITKSITVRSLAGAEQTRIVGQPDTATPPFGGNSIRCVYMTEGTLDGFTLANGFADASACPPYDMDLPVINGGGVYAPKGIRTPQVNNCIITGCGAYRGGGAYWATLNNCTVVSNYINTTSGDGVWGSLVRNSIVVDNGNENYSSVPNSVDETLFTYSCTTPAPGVNFYGLNRDGGNNITNPPLFLAGTLQLATNSPCLNSGNNAYVSGPRDASGGPRIIGSVVDIGAYENTFALYPLTVVNGTGSGNYPPGTIVPIAATNPPAWAVFTGWTGDVACVSNVLSPSTTVTMPNAAVTVTATYHLQTLPEIIGGLLGIPQPVTVSNVPPGALSVDPPLVRLGPVPDDDLAFLSTVYTNAGTLIFPWGVSCEPEFDRLALFIDGLEVASITGEEQGVVTQFVAGAGAHTIQWVYLKDSSGDDGADCGWIQPVTWIPDDLAAELGVPGKPIAFPYGQPGEALPFPYGFAGCFLDTAAPSGAIAAAAVKLGGIRNGIPVVPDSQTNGTEVVLDGAGQLSFRWYTSSQASDYLLCTIDGVEAARISGDSSKTGGWKTFTTNLLIVGAHTVRWSYAKGPSGVNGQDCGWIDNVTWSQFAFVLTVQNGTGNGAAVSTNAVGATVALAADPAPAGQEFVVWDGDTATLADRTAPATTLTMPGRDITVRAVYKVQTLGVSVINGRDAGAWPNEFCLSTGEPQGVYPAGALVRIVADPAPLWQTFDQWTASPAGVVFSNAFADVSMFVMPTNDVTITALFRPQTDAEKLAGALTIRGQPLAISAFSPSGVVAEASGGIRYGDPVVKMGGPSVGPSQSVSLTTTNFVGAGTLLFWTHGDAEKEYDGIQLQVNDVVWPTVLSEKTTNTLTKTVWHLWRADITGAVSITWRFTSDDTYYIHANIVELDRVTWIPQAMIDALGAGPCLPNINAEYDPLFLGRNRDTDGYDFEGEDGGVTWAHDAPGGLDAIRLGAFGYVTNNLLAQVAITNFGTGILTWNWCTRSEAGYDLLELQLDGVRTNWISGKNFTSLQSAWRVLPNNPAATRDENRSLKRIFNFRYSKDSDVSVFEDCGWLRDVVWMPTFALQMTGGTNTSYTLPGPYAFIPEAVREAEKNIFPVGTQISILADPPETGKYFDRWTGTTGALNPGDITAAACTFFMPPYDVSLTATYTTNAPSPSPQPTSPAAQSRITSFALVPTTPALAAGAAALAAALPSMTVQLAFEGAVQTDYEVCFSPALAGPECVWQTLPVTYSEALGDTPDGRRLLRVYVEPPAGLPQGFFRLQPR